MTTLPPTLSKSYAVGLLSPPPKVASDTALKTPSPSLFNCVCHDVTPSPLPKAFYPPPTAKCSYTYAANI